MSEKEKQDVRKIADVYRKAPEYIRGKIDGYAEAIKEQREAAEKKTEEETED